MTITEALLSEFDQEMANTRKMLERVPAGKGDYRHMKSPCRWAGWRRTWRN